MTEIITSILQQEKRCIFCGNPPSEKTKEHVIPQWLIALTGDPNRTWHLGVKFGIPDTPNRQFAADQFQFPACDSCNGKYSSLEDRAKANMTKLLNEQSLTAAEWDDFLDWFDKVRVGLFIGNMILNKDLPIPNPKFFINQRIAAKDRCVLVYPIRADHVGLHMIGAGDPVFFHQPTCFMLSVNNLLFLNISSDFLLAARMGFPFPRKVEAVGSNLGVDDFVAICRAKVPFIRFSFYRPTIGVYQTILIEELLEADGYASLTREDYVQDKMLGDSTIKTKPCISDGGKARFLESTDEVVAKSLSNKETKTFDEYCLRFFDYRQAILDQAVGVVEPSLRGLVRSMMKFNRYAIDQANSGVFSI